MFLARSTTRNTRDLAYAEIGDKLFIGEAEIKSKISGLRAQLGRELNKCRTKRSGQGANENYKTNWAYWERLQFLVPVMQAGRA